MFCLHLQIVMWWLIYYLHILCIFLSVLNWTLSSTSWRTHLDWFLWRATKGFQHVYNWWRNPNWSIKRLEKSSHPAFICVLCLGFGLPIYYQLLWFLQVYILVDKENKFAMSQNYLKFTKMFDDLNVWAYHKRYTQRMWTIFFHMNPNT